MASDVHLIRIQLPSSYELLDLVQLLSDRLSAVAGFDEDATHWVSVSVRESVINAIKHGNREDPAKHATVEFTLGLRARPDRIRRCAFSTKAPASIPRRSPTRLIPRTC